MHDTNALITLFNQLFLVSENTVLVHGESEPEYFPANDHHLHHRVLFANGFFSSALHEISHWCIAGAQRRQKVDYGYWYEPDGRTIEQQGEFAMVEAKPQALEWIFTKACDLKFVVSLDNLTASVEDSLPFKQSIMMQISLFQQQGLPARAQLFYQALAEQFQQPPSFMAHTFILDELQ